MCVDVDIATVAFLVQICVGHSHVDSAADVFDVVGVVALVFIGVEGGEGGEDGGFVGGGEAGGGLFFAPEVDLGRGDGEFVEGIVIEYVFAGGEEGRGRVRGESRGMVKDWGLVTVRGSAAIELVV